MSVDFPVDRLVRLLQVSIKRVLCMDETPINQFRPTTLTGHHVELVPLDLEHHDGLVAAVSDGSMAKCGRRCCRRRAKLGLEMQPCPKTTFGRCYPIRSKQHRFHRLPHFAMLPSVGFVRHEGGIRSIETGRPLRYRTSSCNTPTQGPSTHDRTALLEAAIVN